MRRTRLQRHRRKRVRLCGRATKTADGRTLRGTARYEGFQFKFDLLRSE